jgi:D-alanyl-lipoteichoic acid acyltransferase DltB (MBOAT superfamily)
VIALNARSFWIVCLVAVLCMVPMRSLVLRKTILAGVNIGVLVLLLQWQSLGLLGAVAGTYLVLQLASRPRYRVLITIALGLVLIGLFLLHKLPDVASRMGADGTARILGVIGYSYVALRIVEALRAVFEGRQPPPGPVSTVNYLLPFHMLAAGPIQSYDDFVQHADDQFEPSAGSVLIGVERIASGLFKKFVLAHLLQTVFLTNFETGGTYALLEMQVALVWLFLDFSAYSDIAVGIGTLLGVATPENFKGPLLARNLIDFWERWHMSLSLFIRRNIFIPLQMFLMRQNDGRTPLLSAAVAIAISFLLCGLWHGLGIGFLIWGALQAFGLIIARVHGHVLQTRLGKPRFEQYLANPWFRMAGIFLTFQLQAVALVALIKG